MRNIHLLLIALCIGFQLSAVAQIPYIDSHEVIATGNAMYDTGNYKGALEQYRRVNECDTNYNVALYEIINTLVADSSFAEAKNLAIAAVKRNDNKKRDFLIQLANACDYLDQSDSALSIYKTLMELYPTDHQAWYETGVVYFRLKQYDKALTYFQKAVIINPNHAASHYMMGRVFAMQGRLSEAMMAFTVTLLVTKNTSLARKTITFISSIAEQTDEIRKYYTDRSDQYSNPLFDDIDQVINAKISLNVSYALKIEINDNIFRQSQAMMEKLKYNPSDTGFSMQYYVPLFENIFKGDLFEGCMLLAYSEFGVEVVDNLAKKKKSEIDDARQIVFPYLTKIQKTRVLNYTRRQAADELYHYLPASELILIGKVVGKDDDAKVVGEGALYRYDQTFYGKGMYNAQGKKSGEWKYYYPTGILMREETLNNGNFSGVTKEYYKNGNPEKFTTYDKTGKAVELQEFHYNGKLSTSRKLLRDDEIEEVSYHYNGAKEMTVVTANDKVKDGTYKTYFDNGAISKITTFKNGKTSGEYKVYYLSGQLSEEGSYDDGNLDGPYKEYYENGKIRKKCTFSNGKLEGMYEEYYDNGQLSLTTTYSKNKKKGVSKEYDKAGHLYEELSLNDFVPISIKVYDTTGKITFEKADPNGIHQYNLFYENGNKAFDNTINEDAQREGLITFYYACGAKSSEANYKKGNRDGKTTTYYKCGKIKTEEYYADDVNDGYYKSYHPNGKLEQEGWYKAGKKQGPWRNYYIDGTIKNEIYYLSDYVNGYNKIYNIKGKLIYKSISDYDLFSALVIYDTQGHVVDSMSFPGGNGKYKLVDKYRSPAVEMETNVAYGDLSGPYTIKYLNGQVLEQGTYVEGKKDSNSISYYPDGTIKAKGKFVNGLKNGVWNYYDEKGALTHEENILRGNSNGVTKSYLDNIVRIAYNYKDDSKDGDQVYYGEDNKIAIILKYTDGDVVGYTYMGKDENPVPVIPVKNGTAKIKALYSNGQVSAEMNFLNSNFEGQQKVYFTNGKVAEERNYKNGVINGLFKRYNPEGRVLDELTYEDGEEMGKELMYDKNGTLIISRGFYLGEVDGQTIVKDHATNKSKVYTYYCGDLINITE